ncbi:hypothetical protein Hdeb2414_s0025g00668611 [Helianthus debilis subsp. tardiflorus]
MDPLLLIVSVNIILCFDAGLCSWFNLRLFSVVCSHGRMRSPFARLEKKTLGAQMLKNIFLAKRVKVI